MVRVSAVVALVSTLLVLPTGVAEATAGETQIAAGAYHTCALTVSGAADCWGTGNYGEADDQLGPYTQITAGDYHTCALTPAGAADCWGKNTAGQATGQPGPYIQISAFGEATCALTPSGAVDCWGSNLYYQATDQDGPLAQVSSAWTHTCALTPAGANQCWGSNADGRSDTQSGSFAQITAGGDHTCALTPSGAADCWGSNAFGQATDQAGPYRSVVTTQATMKAPARVRSGARARIKGELTSLDATCASLQRVVLKAGARKVGSKLTSTSGSFRFAVKIFKTTKLSVIFKGTLACKKSSASRTVRT